MHYRLWWVASSSFRPVSSPLSKSSRWIMFLLGAISLLPLLWTRHLGRVYQHGYCHRVIKYHIDSRLLLWSTGTLGISCAFLHGVFWITVKNNYTVGIIIFLEVINVFFYSVPNISCWYQTTPRTVCENRRFSYFKQIDRRNLEMSIHRPSINRLSSPSPLL